MPKRGFYLKKASPTQIIVLPPPGTINICGYVFDSNSKVPLAFASVFIKGASKGVISDEKGFFQIENVKKGAFFSIQHVGYIDETLKASLFKAGNCNTIYLTENTESLQEVLIKGYLTKGIDKNIDGSIALTNRDQGILPGQIEPDVLRGIQLIPGITSLNESASDIQIRGGSADQNLIFFDGIKMYNTGHFFGTISAINPYTTQSAKIYKSGASPEYGDRISGVIDIKSDGEVPQKSTGGLGVNGTHADGFFKRLYR